ncbi:pirin family protein [Flammeovirgaceae bacterium SG7u.111]|nr:pirin family protein [Flammeovirgaceae bacterium SG7u.132]WPO37645.1 pirin family protein [Flammeovirgaceae bacterium SG7u.111]
MSLKKVTHLLPAALVNMDGFPVRQAIPTQKVQQVDPFLLLHHAAVKPLYGRPARSQGVGPHPHRGFYPVTFVVEGEVHHRDSRGNSQVAKTGDVQWMHAGRGIVHSERPSEKLVETRGRQEIIQLWINSPASRKMNQPDYQHLSETEMPMLSSADGKVKSKLVAGKYGGEQGKIRMQSELLVMWGVAEEAGQVTYSIPQGFSSCLYLIKGSAKLKGYGLVDKQSLVVFGGEGSEMTISTSVGSQFLLLSGKPIGEKIVQQGPYVMNSETEILEAIRDYQMGKMGILIEED